MSAGRSRGVTIYGTYAVIAGTLGVALNATAPWFLRRLGQAGAIRPELLASEFSLSALLLASGFGAVALRPWGRWLAIGVALAQIGMKWPDMSTLHTLALPVQIGFWTAMVLRAAIAWFFTRPTVAAQFRRPT